MGDVILSWIKYPFVLGEDLAGEVVETDMYRVAEGSVRWDDPAIGIDWPITEPTLSDKDQVAPLLTDVPAAGLVRCQLGAVATSDVGHWLTP